MKAVSGQCVRPSHPGIKTDPCCLAGKTTAGKADFDSKEMRACFSKLQQLVPNTKCKAGKIDRTELLQCVIDYIYHLEDTLAFSSTGLCDFLDSALVSRQMDDSPKTVSEGGLLPVSEMSESDVRPPSQ